MADIEDLLKFMHTCEKLKKETRKGWTRYEIQEPESVADHSWRMAVICLALDNMNDLDTGKMIRMALIHDLAEALTGDITPGDGITREKKLEMERTAMGSILQDVDDWGELMSLWEEYNAGETREARAVGAVDRLEMALQAVEYDRSGTRGLEEFYEFSPEDFPEGPIRELYVKLREEPAE